jgi:hypothetical protein
VTQYISAIVSKDPVNLDMAGRLELPVLSKSGFAIIALDAAHSDYWCREMGMGFASFSEIFHDDPTTHEFARLLGMKRYALVETDYFGSEERQLAAVYEQGNVIMKASEGAINQALRLLGVRCEAGKDEFHTIELDEVAKLDIMFKKYQAIAM